MKVFIEQVVVNGESKGDLYIESDSMQYMINIYNGKTDKEGKPLYTNKGYYGTLSQAAKQVARMQIHNSTAATLHELVRDIERIEAFIDSKIAH